MSETVAIPPTSESASPAPAALIDGDQMSIVELAEGRPGGVALVRRWEHVEWRPSSPLLDDLPLPFGTQSQRRPFHAPSVPTAEKPIRFFRPGQAEASLEK
jgi:hypothetical protein